MIKHQWLKKSKPFIYLLIIALVFSDCTISKSKNYPIETYSNRERQLREKIDSLEINLDQVKQQLKKRKYEPGKAYVKCAISTTFETVKSAKSYRIYNGSNVNQKGIQKEIIEIRPTYAEWFKVKSSELCEAYSELDDKECEVWYLQEIKSKMDSIFIVVDTSKIKNYEVKFIDLQQVVKESSFTQESEFGCPLVVEVKLIRNIQNALKGRGYKLIGAKDNVMDQITKKALMDFQKENKLPIGEIDFETLVALGLKK